MITHLANAPPGRQALVLRGSKCPGSIDPHESFIIPCVFLLKLLKQAPFCVHLLAGHVWLLSAQEDQTWSRSYISMRTHLPLLFSMPGHMPFQDQKCRRFWVFYIYQGLKTVFGALLHITTFTRQQQRFKSFLPEGLAHFPARSLLFPIT